MITLRTKSFIIFFVLLVLPMSRAHVTNLSVFNGSYRERHSPAKKCNAIYLCGFLVEEIIERISRNDFSEDLFIKLTSAIENILKGCFKDFLLSKHYQYLIRCKSLELKEVGVNSFQILDIIGHGGFG